MTTLTFWCLTIILISVECFHVHMNRIHGKLSSRKSDRVDSNFDGALASDSDSDSDLNDPVRLIRKLRSDMKNVVHNSPSQIFHRSTLLSRNEMTIPTSTGSCNS